MINLLLIGNGKWGKNYLHLAKNISNINLSVAHRDTWKNSLLNIDGVIIATPPESHIEICDYVMSRNIPVLVEKPISFSTEEIMQLQNYKNVPILVNYIQLYTYGYQIIKNTINRDLITNIITNGYNKGPIRNHSSLWDYGPHDLSIILDLVEKIPSSIHIEKTENNDSSSIFKIVLQFDNFTSTSIIGNGGNSKRRDFLVKSDGIQYIYDDTDMPKYHKPPLLNMVETFLRLINGEHDQRAGLDLSIRITNILSYCQEYLN